MDLEVHVHPLIVMFSVNALNKCIAVESFSS